MIVNRPFFEGPAARGVFASRLVQRVLKSALVSSSLVMIVTAVATAQEYPTRPVRLFVGFTAGGPTDVPARFIADKLSAALGKPVVVENKPGAGSMLATYDLLSQRRDGHTLLACTYFDAVNTLLYKMPNTCYPTLHLSRSSQSTIMQSQYLPTTQPKTSVNSSSTPRKIQAS